MNNSSGKKEMRYAIFGGSFDPVHIGHLKLAMAAVEEMDIDKLFLMPNYISPFKQDSKVTATEDRVAMAELLLPYNEAFVVSTYEVDRSGPSYTSETLSHFREILDGELYFVLGFDSVLTIDKWHCAEELMEYPMITGRRPGTEDAEGLAKIEELNRKYGADITVLTIEPFDASSTEIRQRVREGKSTEGLLLPEVRKYIDDHSLYR